MPTSKRRSAAFTIVELLVVIAIIGILVALLVPAVQEAREASRRSQCGNNLHQIGLGYQCYESAYQALPPAYYDPTSPPYPPGSVGWGIFILPYIELKTLYDQYNFKKPFYDGYNEDNTKITGNQQISNTQIPCFLCPSTPPRDPYTYTFSYSGYQSTTWQAAAADYSPVARVAPSLAQLLWPKYPPWSDTDPKSKDTAKLAGVLEPNKSIPTNAILDGTSHTILIAEIAGKNDLWQRGRNTYEKLSGQYGGQGGWADATSAGSVFVGSSEDGSVYPGESGINSSNDYGLYACHRVLANSLFADGSVQSLSAEIDIRLLAGLLTRAGGELENNP